MVKKLITNNPHFGVYQQSKKRMSAQIQFLFFGLVYFDTLAAYNILMVPVPWLSYFISTLLLIVFVMRKSLTIAVPNYMFILILYVFFALFVLGKNTVTNQAFEMPSQATLPYIPFLLVRLFLLVGYIFTVVAVYSMSLLYGTRTIVKILIVALAVIAFSSLYIYISPLFGLWEPSRNRIGTGGQDFTTTQITFSYGFYRALGTFREPGHLAAWIVGIFFFTSSISSSKHNTRNLLVAVLAIIVIILSGSLLGFIALATGILVMLITGRFKFSFRSFLYLLALVAGGMAVIYVFNIDFVGTLSPRIEALLSYGPSATNRFHVWKYFLEVQPPLLGFGLGNSNIKLSSYLGNSLMSSHLSIFLGSWYSLGYIGVLLVTLYLAFPFISVKTWKMARRDAILAACMASLASWLVFYSGNNEEFALIHAVIVGVFFGRLRELRQAK